MKKLLAAALLLVIALPPLLSFIASFYLRTSFIIHLDEDIRIVRYDYEHGWFDSSALIDLQHKPTNLVFRTLHRINHGPVIWPLLLTEPLQAFGWYRVNSDFGIFENAGRYSGGLQENDFNKGTASTTVSYSGKSRPDIQHPGLALRLAGSQVFGDLMRLNGEVSAQGHILANLSANQIEVKGRHGTIYLTQPGMKLSMDAGISVPIELNATASTMTGRLAADEIETGELMLASTLEQKKHSFQLSARLSTDRLTLNEAPLFDSTIKVLAANINEQAVNYITTNYPEISHALQTNQWLVLLSHFARLVEQIADHQPRIDLKFDAIYAEQPVYIQMTGMLLRDSQSKLNPFSILENLEIQIDAIVPVKLVDDINRHELSDFFDFMSDNGLLTTKDGTYYSNMSFEDTKLKIAHGTP